MRVCLPKEPNDTIESFAEDTSNRIEKYFANSDPCKVSYHISRRDHIIWDLDFKNQDIVVYISGRYDSGDLRGRLEVSADHNLFSQAPEMISLEKALAFIDNEIYEIFYN